jgi:hypothetical protein
MKKSGDITDNAPLRSGKGSLYEGGTREPFIVRWPGVTQPGTSNSVPTIHVDIYPTLLEITQAPKPQQVLDGEFFDVVFRKLGNNINILGSSFLGVLVPSALVFGLLVLMRAGTGRVAVLREGFERAPTLRPALTAWLVAMAIGFAVNDSGVAIPAVGIMFAIPALIVVSTRILELQEPPLGGKLVSAVEGQPSGTD